MKLRNLLLALRTLFDRGFERAWRGEAPPRSFDVLYDLTPAELAARAEAGDGKAAYVLGDRYDKGDGPPRIGRKRFAGTVSANGSATATR